MGTSRFISALVLVGITVLSSAVPASGAKVAFARLLLSSLEPSRNLLADSSTALSPIADCYIDSSAAASNFGTANPLVASAAVRRTLLKFDTRLPAGSALTSAVLKLYARTTSTGGFEIHPEGDSWTESGTTWSNQPAWNTTVLATSTAPASGTWLSISLPTNSVNTGGNTNYGIRFSVSGINAGMSSREDATHKPQLILTYSAAVTPTDKPTQTPVPVPSETPVITPQPRGITFVSSATGNNSGSTTLTISAPSGAADGNLMIAHLVVRGSTTTITPPPGWVLIRRDTTSASIAAALYYQIVSLPEPASYTFTFGIAQQASGGISLYSGTAAANPIDASSGRYNAATTIVTASSVTTRSANDKLLFFAAVTASTTVTPPPGMGQRWTAVSGSTTSATADQDLGAAGATGNRAGTSGASATSNIGQLLALRAAGDIPAITPTPDPTSTPTPTSDPDIVIAAAGDIVDTCTGTSCGYYKVSDVILGIQPDAVLALGDISNNAGSMSDYTGPFGGSWGRFKSIIWPVPGNHDYGTTGAANYYSYFGAAAHGPGGYYSFNLGNWHFVGINSNCTKVTGGCAAGSPQEQWLRADLAANPRACVLAFWHHPRYSSGYDGDNTFMSDIFQVLYNAGAEILLSGHSHDYERFAPQNNASQLDTARGITQFVLGTGGVPWTGFGAIKPNSQVHQSVAHGALKLTLRANSYDWRFVPEAGQTWTESGSASCH